MDQPKIVCRNVWKIFGKSPEQILGTVTDEQSNAHIQERTGHVIAVRGVSFAVKRGETFVVMGLSGSGKSTLVRCISRLTEPTAGEVLIDGDDVLKMDDDALRTVRRTKVAMVFQNFGLLPHRRVLDNVAYGLEIRGVDKKSRYETAARVLELVGLKGWEYQYPRQLSGGMQQRVGLARALAVDPEILLFDEPFSALDPLIRREMQDELLRLQATLHKTSIFITHDFAEALKLGDQIAIMRAGQFVQMGTPQELVLNPKGEYVAGFVKDAPRAKVLTVAAVMRPCPADFDYSRAQPVEAGTRLVEILPLLGQADLPLAVVNGGAQPLGYVDRGLVLLALANE
jgi:glycine betaine/proline transport system ATP-binding protein